MLDYQLLLRRSPQVQSPRIRDLFNTFEIGVRKKWADGHKIVDGIVAHHRVVSSRMEFKCLYFRYFTLESQVHNKRKDSFVYLKDDSVVSIVMIYFDSISHEWLIDFIEVHSDKTGTTSIFNIACPAVVLRSVTGAVLGVAKLHNCMPLLLR